MNDVKRNCMRVTELWPGDRDILFGRLSKRVEDAGAFRLIRAHLTLGSMSDGEVSEPGREVLQRSWAAACGRRGREVKRKVADRPLATLTQWVCQMAPGHGERRGQQVMGGLRPYLLG